MLGVLLCLQVLDVEALLGDLVRRRGRGRVRVRVCRCLVFSWVTWQVVRRS